MSKYRDEMVQLRDEHFQMLEVMRRIGDYGAGAAQARQTAETILKLLDLMIERAR